MDKKFQSNSHVSSLFFVLNSVDRNVQNRKEKLQALPKRKVINCCALHFTSNNKFLGLRENRLFLQSIKEDNLNHAGLFTKTHLSMFCVKLSEQYVGFEISTQINLSWEHQVSLHRIQSSSNKLLTMLFWNDCFPPRNFSLINSCFTPLYNLSDLYLS